MGLNFRTLTANEIECKALVVENKIEIYLHLRAETCTAILNEAVGPLNWEKSYTNGNKNCIVSIWDSDKNRMISKEDCGGALTDVDGYKGQASNGFKRVCALGWGIGLELYSQPKITLRKTDDNIVYDKNNLQLVSEQYHVSEIEYDDNRKISKCVICDSNDMVVYNWPDLGLVDEKEEETIIIPDNADELEAMAQKEAEMPTADDNRNVPEQAQIQKKPTCNESDVSPEDVDLPDNTDRYEDEAKQNLIAETRTKEIVDEIKRTHVRKTDVLKSLKIKTIEEIATVEQDLYNEVIAKFKALPTYTKKK